MLNNTDINKLIDFSDTEKKLAEVWKNVLFLSTQKYNALNKSSDFFEFAGWCATVELADLTQQIERVFKISTEPFALDDYSTLSEQAALIDSIVIHEKTILFSTSWIKEVYSRNTAPSIKEAKLEQITGEYQTSFRELLAQLDYDTASIRDIKFSAVENSTLLDVLVQVELYTRKGSALTTKHTLNLLFTLEVTEQEPKILSLKHSTK